MLDASSVKNVQSTDDTIIISDFYKNVNRQFLRTRRKFGFFLLLKVVYTKARRSTHFCNTFNIDLLYIHFSAPRFVLHFLRRKSNTKINVCKSNTNHLKVKSNTMLLQEICITKNYFMPFFSSTISKASSRTSATLYLSIHECTSRPFKVCPW